MGKGPFGTCWAKGPAVFGMSGQLGKRPSGGLRFGRWAPKGAFGAQGRRDPWGSFGAIPNGKQFRVEGNFKWEALISIEGERIIPMKTIPYEL